jgi:hypothetical protein
MTERTVSCESGHSWGSRRLCQKTRIILFFLSTINVLPPRLLSSLVAWAGHLPYCCEVHCGCMWTMSKGCAQKGSVCAFGIAQCTHHFWTFSCLTWCSSQSPTYTFTSSSTDHSLPGLAGFGVAAGIGAAYFADQWCGAHPSLLLYMCVQWGGGGVLYSKRFGLV